MRQNINIGAQYFVSILVIGLVAFFGYILTDIIGYRSVALLLLMAVSILAMTYEIKPVLLAACLSALIWDYFFIPPRFTFTVNSAEDFLFLMMYFIIALLNGVLTVKLRQIDTEKKQKEERDRIISLYNTLLNSLSHELRTPIATIIGASDTLKDNRNILSEKNKNELVDEISKASLRLNHQVSNLLNMSRLQSGTIQLRLDWCDINEFLFTLINKLDKNAHDHRIKIHVRSELPLVKIDSGLIEQVLLNIINNAIFYTPADSEIEISADVDTELEPEENKILEIIQHYLIIKICDKGPGFPENEIQKVFDKFYRLQNCKTGGTGLGLSIAKGFIEAHKGKIELINRTGGGAEFTITIPVEISQVHKLSHE